MNKTKKFKKYNKIKKCKMQKKTIKGGSISNATIKSKTSEFLKSLRTLITNFEGQQGLDLDKPLLEVNSIVKPRANMNKLLEQSVQQPSGQPPEQSVQQPSEQSVMRVESTANPANLSTKKFVVYDFYTENSAVVEGVYHEKESSYFLPVVYINPDQLWKPLMKVPSGYTFWGGRVFTSLYNIDVALSDESRMQPVDDPKSVSMFRTKKKYFKIVGSDVNKYMNGDNMQSMTHDDFKNIDKKIAPVNNKIDKNGKKNVFISAICSDNEGLHYTAKSISYTYTDNKLQPIN